MTLFFSELVAAGFNGSYNSTASPAVRTVQLASILCNASTNGHQGYIRNNSVNGTAAATRFKNSPLCKQLSQQPQQRNHTDMRQRSRHHPKEVSRIPDRYTHTSIRQYDTVHGSTALQKNDPPRGTGKHRRSAKLQEREQKWDKSEQWKQWEDWGKRASLEMETSSEEQTHPVAEKGKARHQTSKRSASTIPVVTDCPECDSVETGSCETEGKKNVPFKMMRNHGVVAIPHFDMDGEGAVATQNAEPKILIKKFREIDGDMQPDTGFSDDGMDDMSIPLPTGDRVTGFTLAKDKLVVQSRPENFEGFSRITTLSLNDTDSLESVDGGSAPGLWVRGDLYRYHDDTLYTFSDKENRVYIYPQSEPDSIHSAAPVRVVDLKPVRSAGEELVSVLADGEQTYVAVRKAGSAIKVSQVNGLGEVVSEDVRRTQSDREYQLGFRSGKPVLETIFSGGSLSALACSDSKALCVKRKRSTDNDSASYGSEDHLDSGTIAVIVVGSVVAGFLVLGMCVCIRKCAMENECCLTYCCPDGARTSEWLDRTSGFYHRRSRLTTQYDTLTHGYESRTVTDYGATPTWVSGSNESEESWLERNSYSGDGKICGIDFGNDCCCCCALGH
ncbi:hypothetical protein [Sansalvadorimonas verongulae]|uniref:hypothetical protein n=1 Tax=Sansalvadorimonas verongulae TaxID=2172824 RepID=UPI0012BC419F|nr:hypothetical protein [Sansalvadorimonas verongulae]MTI11941.1 hypothetical protein [Sansalvadorimonas verongulae]